MKRIALRVVLAAAAALVVASCSLTQLAYSNVGLAYTSAEPALRWLVGDYVDMSHDQKDFVQDRIHRAFLWHRSQELPEYKRFFEKVLQQAEDNISVDEAAADHRAIREYYHHALERLIPDLADLLLQLNEEQADYMEARFNKENRKIVGDLADTKPEKRREKRYDRFLGHVEQFTGKLDRRQRELVAAYVAEEPELSDEWLADRRYRQAGVLAVVRDKPPRDKAIAELHRLLVETESWRNPDYQKKLKERDQQMFRMISRLSESLTPGQRQHFQSRVRGLMRDLTELSARAGAPG